MKFSKLFLGVETGILSFSALANNECAMDKPGIASLVAGGPLQSIDFEKNWVNVNNPGGDGIDIFFKEGRLFMASSNALAGASYVAVCVSDSSSTEFAIVSL
ncbi:MAG: hypothetical protein AAF202_13275, partial [Pseudomonadota bacterium]